MTPITDYPYSDSLMSDPKWFWNRKTSQELNMPYNPEDHEALISIAQNNKKLFQLLSTTIPTLDGWCDLPKACVLTALTLTMKPKVVVEIGTFGGRSFIPMLWGLKENGSGKAIGIDPYSAQISSESEFPGSSEWWASVDHGLIEKKFHFLLKTFGLNQYAELVKKKSDDANPPENIDLFHLDGSHVETCIRDANRFGAKVRIGGIVVNDDLNWTGGSPRRAVDALEEMGFRVCYERTAENWNVMQRIK